MRSSFLVLFALLAAAPLASQRSDVPRRPRLPAAADSNDARAYFRLGQDLLDRRPRDAADAFYWASQLEPGWADPLYGRHVALLMSDPRRLALYYAGDRQTRRSAAVQSIDSLYYRALRIDPFLQRRFDRELIRRWLVTVVSGGEHDVDMPLVSFYSQRIMDDLPPLARARILSGEGKLAQALAAFDQALRERNRRWSEPLRVIRHERARMFARAGNDSMALVELRHALDAGIEEEQGDELVFFYQSKAVLEHSMGRVHERTGDADAAREAYARALMEDLAYYPAHVRMGVLAMASGDTATAVQELALAAEAGRDDASVRLAYATLLASLRRLPEAEAELMAAVELAPYYAEPWFLLGMVRDWRQEGDSTTAYRAFLARARADDPRRPQVEPLVAALP
jgi:tetratricopeptide (TPR) repeat protein